MLLSFYCFGVYRFIWHYAGLNEFLTIIIAATSGTIIVFVFTSFLIPQMPKFLNLALWFSSLILLGGIRFISRITWNLPFYPRNRIGKKTIIVGAGEAGALIIRTLKFSKTKIGLNVIGFIDDNPAKKNCYLYGTPVLGTSQELPVILTRYQIEEAIIAIPTASPEQIKKIAQICQENNVSTKILPSVLDIIQGKQLLGQMRDLKMEDLLHRSEVNIDLEQVGNYLKDQAVLVTGAGGSIGSELCRQICKFSPEKLILVGHGENSVNDINLELTHTHPHINCLPVIVDIRDYHALLTIFNTHNPSVIFHAGAHKHVNLMQQCPEEAFKNNVFGTLNLVRAAESSGVNRFVLISTDKAVLPSSIMGLTKLLAEMVVRHYAQTSNTIFTCVRFGNVLGSRGSVVELFRKQIASGGPVSVTHPEMSRYFMTIKEAVQLVMQASALAKGGEVFILDMGKPVRIIDLAQDMIRFLGLRPGIDIDIKFTGIRPGEKLSEELHTEKEKPYPTTHEKIFVLEPENIDYDLINLVLQIHGFPSPDQVVRLKKLALNKFPPP
ncbi:MAG: nucleoside-diphosphate sugar epimerase/dehydratase [Desulfitobacteriaceae bacterium]|nr:nucleoside-diphosphate sugar epimerase/dehydratase [Desulfitobacteriaceae bacterium]